ncbi:hypothetical protein ABZ468_24915 [Streptomyces sp. NPDC005708]|uniref:hypothetical protein n=1 Tax=Streptomyces sp. NPDC005708 TaxID=3154564 RepID=UPI0033D533DF
MLGVARNDEVGVVTEEVLLLQRGLLRALRRPGFALLGGRGQAHGVGVPVVALAYVPAGVGVGGEFGPVGAAAAREGADGRGVDAERDLCEFAQEAVEGAYGGVQQEFCEQGEPPLPFGQVVDVRFCCEGMCFLA